MSNKKQIHLKTITIDWPTAVYNSSNSQFGTLRPKGSLLLTPKAPQSKAKTQESQVESKIGKKNNSRVTKKKSLSIKRINQYQLNRITVDKFLSTSSYRNSKSCYQQFPKRQSPFKNGNAFKFYLNSSAAYHNYTMSIADLEKVHIKLKEDRTQRICTIRPSTCKERIHTELVSDQLRKSQPRERVKPTLDRKRWQAKGHKCKTAAEFQPWETVEEKFYTEW